MAIFFDASKKRKWYFRGGVLVLYLLFFLSTCIFVSTLIFRSEDRTPITYREAALFYDHYYSAPQEKKIAITIDDGPEGKVTQQLMDTLERHNAPATFFLIGAKALLRPDTVQEIHNRGFEIGVHSFTHDPSSHDSERRISLEAQATANVIEHLTGERVVYYRPPFLFGVGIDPTMNPYIPVPRDVTDLLQNGFLPVGSDIDPKDWLATSSEELIAHMKPALTQHEGSHIILLHEMPHTAEALDTILTELKQNGYTLVSLDELLLPSYVAKTASVGGAMLPAATVESLTFRSHTLSTHPLLDAFLGGLSNAYIHAIALFHKVYAYIVIAVLALVVIRVLLLAAFVKFDMNRKKRMSTGPYLARTAPGITILIPAFNESANIHATITSALRTDYPKKEIIIIDDGSTDDTAEIVASLMALDSEGIVKLIRKDNGGKASALNVGIASSRYDIVVVIDADTVVDEGALAAFAPHFKNPDIGAVSGQVRLASTSCLLEYFQRIEYAIGQNVERRAFSALGIVDVVPGAAGAWRKRDLLAAGGFSADTLVEDQDMTLSILRIGKQVIYEPRAITYTETPQTLANFVKQRLRWTFGTMQCFAKQTRATEHMPWGKLRVIVIPHVFIFSIALPFILPLVDFAFFFGIATGQADTVIIPFLIMTFFDSLYALWGLWNEPDRFKLLALVPLQRLSYRQLLYYTFLKSIVRVVEGTESRWNKLARSGSTQAFYYSPTREIVGGNSTPLLPMKALESSQTKSV